MSRNYAGVARLELFLFKSGSAFPAGDPACGRRGASAGRLAPPTAPTRLRRWLMWEDRRPARGHRQRGTGGMGRAGSDLLALRVWRDGHRQVLKRWALGPEPPGPLGPEPLGPEAPGPEPPGPEPLGPEAPGPEPPGPEPLG